MPIHNLSKNTLIFTDLDATLLEHESYSFTPANEMLNFLKIHNIPLIIVTSKTKEEVLRIQKRLGITGPMIIENGAGIVIARKSGAETIAMGKTYAKTREAFEKYAKDFEIRGFFEMSVEEISAYTKLPLEEARDAKKRLFTEPFAINDEKLVDALNKMADKDGFEVVKGGRFYHLITKGQDKAAAVKRLIEHYEKTFESKFKTLALGDSANDFTMFQSVDTPILIPQPDGNYLPCNIPRLIKAPLPGPAGWNAALKAYFHVK
jgi:mannosyl-3-phosphoglycerate phosphatase